MFISKGNVFSIRADNHYSFFDTCSPSTLNFYKISSNCCQTLLMGMQFSCAVMYILQFRDNFEIHICSSILFLKSLNGVFLNGKRLEPLQFHELSDGDIVQFGVKEKPDSPAEFQYRYYTGLKVSRKAEDFKDGSSSNVKRIKLEGQVVLEF